MSGKSAICCPECQSDHVLPGQLQGYRGGSAAFRLHNIKIFTLALYGPDVSLSDEAYVCLECGLLWSSMSTQDLRRAVESWGNEDLKAKVQDWEETPAQILLRPAAEGSGSPPGELLRPAPPESSAEER